ncbi:hypothetical protein O181_064996 [Austropuccinia psidii MF-1]|uniref:Uncharacterized protein n=1 Tax=Austropuccinia psidii MF-1 TaxID=1389203 RepID=A0A9Q3I0U8_9BASI|nr:hypothetical protein [Austropuccinia psidii MF-1]
MQSLQLALSSPPPALSPYHQKLCTVSSAYDCFMQEPYRVADQSNHLQSNRSNFAEWVSGLNRVLCVALNSKQSVNDCPSFLEDRSLQENRAISHFINAMLPPDFSLCIGVVLARMTAKGFFDTVRARCCPGHQFQKLKVVCNLLDILLENVPSQPKPNSTVILTLFRLFSLFKKLGFNGDELKGLLAQAACHAPSTLDQVAFDQLVMAEILAKGNEKPLLTFVGKVILSTLQKSSDSTQCPSPFMYCVSDPLEAGAFYFCPRSPHFPNPVTSTRDVH